MDQNTIDFLKKEFPHIKMNEPMKKRTSINVGGNARFFYEAEDSQKLESTVSEALKLDIPYIVIGNGTNIIFADAGFDGLVIKNSSAKILFEANEAIIDSGMSLQRMLRKLAEADLGGLEFLTGIPGSLGGAIYGNAGAYGGSMADIVKGVVMLDIDGKKIQISNQDMKFGYRTSYLKETAKIHDRFKLPVILSARIKVYPKTKEGVLRVMDNYINIRQKKYPLLPSSGSFFKNVEITGDLELSKEAKGYVKEGKIPAGLLIEKAGCKDMKVGGAKVSKEHANFLVNTGRAKAKDFIELSENVKKKVEEAFGIKLKEEVEFIGDFNAKPQNLFDKILRRS